MELFKNIFDAMEDKNPKDEFGETPLHKATQSQNSSYSEICQLIVANIKDKNPQDFVGRTPLHHAAMFGNFDACQLLIENVDDKNPQDNYGLTPLHIAAKYGHYKVCQLILKNIIPAKSVDTSGKTKGWSKLDISRVKNPADKSGKTPLHMAAENGHLDVYSLICENANHKNPPDLERVTPLHLAAEKGLLLMCRSILTYVPEDKNSFDENGKTPCDLAKEHGHYRLVKFFETGEIANKRKFNVQCNRPVKRFKSK